MSALFAFLLVSGATVPVTKPPSTPSVIAEKPVPAGKVFLDNPRSVVAKMQSEGYRAKLITNEDTLNIESGAEKATFFVYFQGCTEKRDCEDLMFRSSYDIDKDSPVKLDAINKFNRDFRFARAYLEEDGSPAIEMDLLFTDRLMDEKTFADSLAIWSDVLGNFHKAIGW